MPTREVRLFDTAFRELISFLRDSTTKEHVTPLLARLDEMAEHGPSENLFRTTEHGNIYVVIGGDLAALAISLNERPNILFVFDIFRKSDLGHYTQERVRDLVSSFSKEIPS